MRVLVCPPDHFDVDYVINPWMEGQRGRVDRERAKAQWSSLTEAYARLATLETIAPLPGQPDMVFTANAGLVDRGRAMVTRFRMPERSGEEPAFASWFRDAGFEEVPLPGDDPFEGEGDALFQPGEPLLWAGYGVRSALENHVHLGRAFGVEVVSLRLVDPRFYHLDTCFAPLPDGRVLYYPPAFDERSQRLLERRVPAEKRLAVGDEDALGFCCNVFRIDDQLFLNQASASLQSSLAAWGFETHVCPVDEFLKAGGGVKCLSLILDQAPFEAIEPAPPSSIRATPIELRGHLLDRGGLNRALDIVTDAGGSFRVVDLSLAERKDQESRAELRVVAPSAERLDGIVAELMEIGGERLEVSRRSDSRPGSRRHGWSLLHQHRPQAGFSSDPGRPNEATWSLGTIPSPPASNMAPNRIRSRAVESSPVTGLPSGRNTARSTHRVAAMPSGSSSHSSVTSARVRSVTVSSTVLR